jgi:hypothetical protein
VSRGLSSASAAAHQQFRVQTYNAISPVGLQVYTTEYTIATVRPAQRSGAEARFHSFFGLRSAASQCLHAPRL